MNKGKVIGTLKQHGDVVITFKTLTKTVSHHLCTLEFKNRYIKSHTKGKKPWPKNKADIVVFDWTDNKYLVFNPNTVVKLQPLSDILQNIGPE